MRRRSLDPLLQPWAMPGVQPLRSEEIAAPSTSVQIPDNDEVLSDWLAPGYEVGAIEGLDKLVRAATTLSAFSGLLAGSAPSVQARVALLRGMGERTDSPEWSPQEIDAHFAWLDTVKRDTTLKRLAEHRLIAWDLESRAYSLTSMGRIVLLAVEQVLRVTGDGTDDAGADLGFIAGQLAAEKVLGFEQTQSLQLMLSRLVELQRSFETALESGSESRLQQAAEAVAQVKPRMQQATSVLHQLVEDGQLGDRAYRTAQRIGREQSKLMQSEGMLARAMAEMARQRVTLSRVGLTDADLRRWFFEQPIDAWSRLALPPATPVAALLHVAGDVALDVAEAQLLRDLQRDDVALPPPADVANGEYEAQPLPPEFAVWRDELLALSRLPQTMQLAHCVPATDFTTSAYRMSLLSLLGEVASDAEQATIAELAFRVVGGDGEPTAVQRCGVALISDARLVVVEAAQP